MLMETRKSSSLFAADEGHFFTRTILLLCYHHRLLQNSSPPSAQCWEDNGWICSFGWTIPLIFVSEKEKQRITKLDSSFFPDISSHVYSSFKVLLFCVFVYRGASHIHTHTHTHALKHGQQGDTFGGFNCFVQSCGLRTPVFVGGVEPPGGHSGGCRSDKHTKQLVNTLALTSFSSLLWK